MCATRAAAFSALRAGQVHRLLNAHKRLRQQVTVLCLHRVSYDADPFWPPLSPPIFRALLDYAQRAFTIIPLAGLQDWMRHPGRRPALILTFDDGYADFGEHVLPVLRQRHLPAVLCPVIDCLATGQPIWTERLNRLFAGALRLRRPVSVQVLGRDYTVCDQESCDIADAWERRGQAACGHSACQGCAPQPLVRVYLQIFHALLAATPALRQQALVDLEACLLQGGLDPRSPAPPRMLTWAELRAVQRDGVEIGSHSLSHDALHTIRDPAHLRRELDESRRILRAELGAEITAVSFPNGGYNDKVVAAAAAAGYRHLLTLDGGSLARSAGAQTPLLIPRTQVRYRSLDENIFHLEQLHYHLFRGHS